MPLTAEQTKEIIKTYGASEKDTGSTAVQIALLSARIKGLTEHLKINKKSSEICFEEVIKPNVLSAQLVD